MSKAISHKFLVKFLTIYTMVCILLVNFPLSALAAGVSVSVTANGLSALTLSSSTDTFTIDVSSTNATACQTTSPSASGIATSVSMSMDPKSFYPSVGGNSTFTVTCTDGVDNATGSVIVSLPATPPVTLSVDIKAVQMVQ